MVQVFKVGSSEPQVVSAWWKETAQTRVFVLSRSLLLNHLEPQSSKTKLLLPIMLIGIVTCATTTTTTLFILDQLELVTRLYTFVEQRLSKQLYTYRGFARGAKPLWLSMF